MPRTPDENSTISSAEHNQTQDVSSMARERPERASGSQPAQSGRRNTTDPGRCGDRRHWRGTNDEWSIPRVRKGRSRIYRAIPSPMVRTRPVSRNSAPAEVPEMRDSRMEATSEAAEGREGQDELESSSSRGVERLTRLRGSVEAGARGDRALGGEGKMSSATQRSRCGLGLEAAGGIVYVRGQPHGGYE